MKHRDNINEENHTNEISEQKTNQNLMCVYNTYTGIDMMVRQQYFGLYPSLSMFFFCFVFVSVSFRYCFWRKFYPEKKKFPPPPKKNYKVMINILHYPHDHTDSTKQLIIVKL